MSGEGHLAPAARHATHADFCGWHVDQYSWECTCGTIPDPDSHRPPWIGPAARLAAPSTDDGAIYRNGDGTRAGNWMQTYSGRQFWPLDPRASEVFIEDIAHALSNACRFAGHCESFYSVAEHSVLVSQVVPRELALMGLLHDASEAYVVDIPRPLKPFISGYKEIEHRVWLAIAERFGVPAEMPKAIKDADNAVLLAEAAQILKAHPAPWCVPGEAAVVTISCWEPETAEHRFMNRFRELAAGSIVL